MYRKIKSATGPTKAHKIEIVLRRAGRPPSGEPSLGGRLFRLLQAGARHPSADSRTRSTDRSHRDNADSARFSKGKFPGKLFSTDGRQRKRRSEDEKNEEPRSRSIFWIFFIRRNYISEKTKLLNIKPI